MALKERMTSRSWRAVLAAAAVGWAGVAVVNGPPATAAPDPVLTAVGDITTCTKTGDDATAALAAAVPGPIAALGDLVEGKNDNEYRDCFMPSGWGALKDRIRPVPGDNGEYGRGVGAAFANATPQLDDYHALFGAAAGSPEAPWYSYEVGTWHVIALDDNCSDTAEGCIDGSPMVEWLKSDLAAHPNKCTAITMHHNFIDEPGRVFGSLKPVLQPAYDAGVDLVISGHRHTYRRYAPVNIAGERDDVAGIRQFVVGTGGHPRNAGNAEKGIVAQGENGVLQVSHGDSWGVMRLTLKPGGYDWDFKSAAVEGSDGTFGDAGSGTCLGEGVIPAEETTTTTTGPTGPTTSTTTQGGTTTGSPAGARSGYWMLGVDGKVYPFGDAADHGSAGVAGSEAVDLEPTPTYRGYWIVDRTGTVRPFGDATRIGSVAAGAMVAGEEATSLSATPTGRGYWVFTNRGRVVPFGDAAGYGDMSATKLNGPVLDSIPTPSGLGYYMVASDGGIFAFGDASFYGSMGGKTLNAPVQSLVPDADNNGYWLVASDGGIFAFDAPFKGSMGDKKLNKPVTGMVRFGDGYLMVGEDGGIFNFSTKGFFGSLGDRPPARPVTSVAVLDEG